MSSRPHKAVLVLLLLSLLAALVVGGALMYEEIQIQHDRNQLELERFGYDMVASNSSFESTGELGAKQLPPTFDEEKLTPTQRVIRSLIRDKENLIKETHGLKSQIEALQHQVNALQAYKQLNERFAPEKLSEEIHRIERQLRAFLVRSTDAERFSTLQIEIMSAAAAAEYKTFVTRYRLMLPEDKKQAILTDLLPAYAFCIGDAAELAANSATEERKLAAYFRSEDASQLSEALYQDLVKVIEPCQLDLRRKLDQLYSRPTKQPT